MLPDAGRLKEIAQFLYLQRVKGFEVSDTPWLDDETREWLERKMPLAKMYLEFGAGGSTRLAGRLGIPTVSVEADRFFARAVRDGLAEGHKVTLLDADIGLTMEWAIPMPGTPNDARAKRWKNYIVAPFAYLERSGSRFPDLVMVDGRFRRACILQTALKAREAGAVTQVLFDDYHDSGREHYHQVEDLLGSPQRIGRSAVFAIDPANEVQPEHVEKAIRDYR